MKKTLILALSSLMYAGAAFAAAGYDVVGIIWPAYHPAPRWKELGIFEHGNGEWQNIYEAKPKFEGHDQPKVPLWGYEDESDPIVIARRIDAALAAGINVFMYDWYWYQNRPFLENALNNGFLKAPNNERMKFFLMWANHNVDYLWNNKKAVKKADPALFDARVSMDEYKEVLVPRFISYFKKPNYYKIEGKPVMSLFVLRLFVKGVGGLKEAREAVEYLDSETKKAGFPGVHFMMVGSLPKEISKDIKVLPNGEPTSREALAKYLHIDSDTCYNWCQYFNAKDQDYGEWCNENIANWSKVADEIKIPYFPNVTTGWDNNPRYPEGTYTKIVKGSNPKDYERALRAAKKWIDANVQKGMPKMIFINSWNEWTEGGYLEPDQTFGYGFLNATARVFGGCGQQSE